MNLNSTGFNNIMEKVPQNGHFQDQKLHQNQEPLKCPRCDSSNTKFCYYNNYSLSQPRHFCKACKRYWTRGGTLRNVPVGGGCRRNKRVRKTPNSSSSSSSSAINLEANCNSNQNPVKDSISSQMGLISSGSNHMNPLFYGLPNTTNRNSEINVNFPFSRFDLEPTSQISGLGLGYDQEYKNGFHSSKQLLQDLIFPSSLGSNYTTTLGSSNTSTTPSTISSLLASKYNNFQPFLGYDEVQMKHGSGVFTKDVKMEDAQNRSIDPNQIDQMNVGSSDSSFLWNGNSFGAWVDPSNSGSSVPSLI